jgi:hypothetical protein
MLTYLLLLLSLSLFFSFFFLSLSYPPPPQARNLLERIVDEMATNRHDEGYQQAGKVAMHTLAMLQLCLSETDAADAMLKKLQFRYRLNAQVFSSTVAHSGNTIVPMPGICVYDKALPNEVLERLGHAFHRSMPFWEEHRYGEPTTGYFSYSYPKFRNVPAKNCVEDLIKTHIFPLVVKSFPEEMVSSISHAEWWTHSRDQISGHQLHYDTDESRLTKENDLHFPIISTVWYITPGVSGAPTLITDKMFGQDALQSKGWLVFPEGVQLIHLHPNCMYIYLQFYFIVIAPFHCRKSACNVRW